MKELLSKQIERLSPRTATAILVLGLAFSTGCAGPAVLVPQTPGQSQPAAVDTPSPAAVFAAALKRLQAAESYKFRISATHYWSLEGKPQEWSFQGEGAASGGKFRSSMEGPAESVLAAKHIDGKIEAWDNKGKIAGPSTTFGGPGPGAAPYTVIAYLKKSTEVALAPGSPGASHFTFKPDMAAVAALDAAHASAMERVKKVEGDVWVTPASGNIEMEKVRVEFLGSSGVTESVSITLEFYDYDKAVSFD